MEIRMIEIEKIVEDSEQPRREMDNEALDGLAESIRQYGILQPITVRSLNNVNMYQIVTGERRWRAAQLIGMEKIPCIIKSVAEGDEILTEQIIENLQREDLQPLDKAKALNTIKHHLMITNKDLAERLGLSERAVGNLLAIMNLPSDIGEKIISSPNRPSDGRLTEKHARHLRQLNDDPDMQSKVVSAIERDGLTGDEAGRLVSRIKSAPDKAGEFLSEEGTRAFVMMPEEKFSGPAVKVVDVSRYLQGLELTRLSGKQLDALTHTMTELKATLDILLSEIREASVSKSSV